jgi:hypothetical protein
MQNWEAARREQRPSPLIVRMHPNIGKAIARAETHNAAKAEYDRLAASRIKLGAEIPSEDMTAQSAPSFM